MAEKKSTANKPENNIQFVGKRRRYNPETDKIEMVKRDAPAFVMDGGDRLKLPDGIAKGAYSEHAARLIAAFPNDFKTPTDKGAK